MTSVLSIERHRTAFLLCDSPLPFLCPLCRKRRGTPSGPAGSERIEALRYQRVKKVKKFAVNNNNSKARKKMGETSLIFAFILAVCNGDLAFLMKKKPSCHIGPYSLKLCRNECKFEWL